tara:strand:+ start:2118 stop:3041 length:924 start_codon:yes stop_codon:yes gene_type:complete
MTDVISVLRNVLGNHTKIDHNGNTQFYCISCNHKNKKLAVNINTLKFQCWVCGERGSIANFLFRMGYKDAARTLQPKKIERSLDDLFATKKTEEVEKEQLEFPSSYYGLYANKNKPRFYPAINYLNARGITEDDFIKYNIHYSIKDERVLFPSYDLEQNLNYHLARSIDPEMKFKYANAKVRHTDIIFNEHLINWSKTLFLVEGVFDAIACRQNATPLLGSFLSVRSLLFKKIVAHQTPIVLALDPDAEKKMFKCAKNLITLNTNIFYIDWGREVRDISEMGSQAFAEIAIDHITKYGLKNEILSRL